MIKMTAAAFAATISLALTSGVVADVASSTSTAPVKVERELHRFSDRPYADIIRRHANAAGVPVELAHAVISIESSYRADVTGGAGEVGLMQIKPATARDMGFEGSTKSLYDPDTNIKYGMRYLAGALERGDGTTCGTILKYNAGHYAKRMNPVSANYCKKVKVELAKA